MDGWFSVCWLQLMYESNSAGQHNCFGCCLIMMGGCYYQCCMMLLWTMLYPTPLYLHWLHSFGGYGGCGCTGAQHCLALSVHNCLSYFVVMPRDDNSLSCGMPHNWSGHGAVCNVDWQLVLEPHQEKQCSSQYRWELKGLWWCISNVGGVAALMFLFWMVGSLVCNVHTTLVVDIGLKVEAIQQWQLQLRRWWFMEVMSCSCCHFMGDVSCLNVAPEQCTKVHCITLLSGTSFDLQWSWKLDCVVLCCVICCMMVSMLERFN